MSGISSLHTGHDSFMLSPSFFATLCNMKNLHIAMITGHSYIMPHHLRFSVSIYFKSSFILFYLSIIHLLQMHWCSYCWSSARWSLGRVIGGVRASLATRLHHSVVSPHQSSIAPLWPSEVTVPLLSAKRGCFSLLY